MIEKFNRLAESIYFEYFNEAFDSKVEWSKRMVKIAGICQSDGIDGVIRLNYYYYMAHGEEAMVKILRHELCHLYCFRKIGMHNDDHPLFLRLLKKVGGDLKGRPMPTQKFVYACPCCQREWSYYQENKKTLACTSCSKGTFNSKYKIEFKRVEVLDAKLNTLKSKEKTTV